MFSWNRPTGALSLHEKQDVAMVITRGAGNGAVIAGLIPFAATVFAWKQNDELKNGKRAGDDSCAISLVAAWILLV